MFRHMSVGLETVNKERMRNNLLSVSEHVFRHLSVGSWPAGECSYVQLAVPRSCSAPCEMNVQGVSNEVRGIHGSNGSFSSSPLHLPCFDFLSPSSLLRCEGFLLTPWRRR